MKKTGFRITFEDGETLTRHLRPSGPREYIATVSPNLTTFTGKFGIDWVTMDARFSSIDTFQEIKVADISHIVDGPSSSFVTTGTAAQKQALVKEIYKIEQYHTTPYEYPVTWINLANGETADLQINTFLLSGRNRNTDFLTIVKNPNFEIEYNGATDAGGTPIKIPLPRGTTNANNAYNIKITAKATFATAEYIIITDYLGAEVGRIEMAPNDTVDLDVRIIPVVFKSNTAQEVREAIALHTRALNGGLLDTTLNEKSLNQAGIKSVIEPVNITATKKEYVAIDLSSATDNWNEYYRTSDSRFQDWNFATSANKPAKSIDEDGTSFDPNRPVTPPTRKFFLDKLEEAYANYKTFKGAIIFVTDKEFFNPSLSPTDLQEAYSQNDPLRNKGVIVFNAGMDKPDVYAHEIAHMLGAEHTFFESQNNTNLADATRYTATNTIADRKKEVKVKIATAIKEMNDAQHRIDNDLSTGYQIQDDPYIVQDTPAEIKTLEDRLQRIDVFSTITNFKVPQTKTKNYMDYIPNRTYFNKNQANILKDELKKYYK